MRRLLPSLLIAALPHVATAESTMIGMDLNGDGRVERFSIVPGSEGVDLQIENTGGGVIYFENIAENATLSGSFEEGLRVTTIRPMADDGTLQQSLIINFRPGGYVVTELEFIRSFPGTDNPMFVEGWFLACRLDLVGHESLYVEYDMLVGISSEIEPFSPANWTAESTVPEPCAELLQLDG